MQSASEIALSHFRQPPLKLPCSSVVIGAFLGFNDPKVNETVQYRHGNAPNNECGASYAAKLLRPDLEEIITQKFVGEGSSVSCKQLKQSKTSCEQCVKMACDVLEENGMTAVQI